MERFQDNRRKTGVDSSLEEFCCKEEERNRAVAVREFFFFPSLLFSLKDGAISTCEYGERNDPVQGKKG